MSEIFGLSPRQIDQVERFFKEGNEFRKVEDRGAYIDHLLDTPGLNPVLAVADGHPDDLPKQGWLVRSKIAPGYGGVIDFKLFPEGSLKIKHTSDAREKYGQVRVGFELNGYGSHTMAYENPNFPCKDEEPHSRMSASSYTGLPFSSTEIIPLSNGGRLLDQASPIKVFAGISSFQLDWSDWTKESLREYAPDMEINRVAHGYEELGGLILHLTAGMGMDTEDIRTFVDVAGRQLAGY